MEKAFDKVSWEKLFEILKKAGLKYKDRRIIRALYKEEIAVIRCGNAEEQAKIKSGVRQGCSLSPILFNCYIQFALEEMREVLQNTRGVRIQGRKIDMIRYADDIALIADSEEELIETITTMKDILSTYNMKLNVNKTKIMVITKEEAQSQINVTLDGDKIKNVRSFPYLGSRITQEGKASQEISSRIHLARLAFNKKSKILESNNIDLEIRKRLLKTLVWSVLLYGSETWCIYEHDKNKLEAFEMWCYRRILKISWRDHTTNEEVLRRIKEKRSLIATISIRRAKWIGHILRHDGLLKNIIEGMVEGTNSRGRQRKEYLHDIIKDLGCDSYMGLKRTAQDRQDWKIRWKHSLQTNR